MLQRRTIAFIGGGNITRCMLSGLLKKHHHLRSHIQVSNRGQEKLANLASEFGVRAAKSNSDAVQNADIVFLSVKPQFVREVCFEISTLVNYKKPLVVSLVTATCIEDIAASLKVEQLGIVRTMTNTAISVEKGTTAMFANSFVTEMQKKIVEEIFNAVGSAFWVEKELEINAFSPLIGCGPAYLFLLVEAMQKAAIARGIPEPLATRVALDCVYGAAELAKQSNTPVEELRKRVTTPNGVTERALKPIMEANYFNLFFRAFEEGEKRCNEIEEANRANSFFPPHARL